MGASDFSKLPYIGEALDGDHLTALGLCDQHGAGFHRTAINVHRAGAALAGVTAHMGAGEHQVLSQRMDKQGIGRDVNTGSAPVDRELDLHLAVS